MKKNFKNPVERNRKLREASLRNGSRPPSRLGISPTTKGNRKFVTNCKSCGILVESSFKKVFCSRTCCNLFLSKNGSWNKGKKLSISHIEKISGENGNNWQGGVTPINTKIRHSAEYRDWRTKVFQRDNYICQDCGSRGFKLNADHIKPFAYYPELRLVIDNGRTLCVDCHKKTDTYWAKAKSYVTQTNLI